MPIRWVISPVVETIGADGTRYRESFVGQIADPGRPGYNLVWTAIFSDGLPGQINDWCLCQAVGADLSGLNAAPGVVDLLEFDLTRSGRRAALQATIDDLGFTNQKLQRIRDRLIAKGVDVSGLNRQSRIVEVLKRLGDRVNPRCDPLREATIAVLRNAAGDVIGEVD